MIGRWVYKSTSRTAFQEMVSDWLRSRQVVLLIGTTKKFLIKPDCILVLVLECIIAQWNDSIIASTIYILIIIECAKIKGTIKQVCVCIFCSVVCHRIYIYTQFSLHIESIDNTKDKALEPTLIVLLCCIERIHGTECSGPRQV